MTKSKILLFSISLLTLTSCTSIQEYLPKFNSQSSVPNSIKETVASRVKPDLELYVLTSADVAKSGSMLAQARANKEASSILRDKVKEDVTTLFKNYISEMDAFSQKVISSSTTDLINYATDLSMKKVVQKGAWEDSAKIYSLLAIDRTEIKSITDKVFKNFINERTKDFGKSVK